MTKLFFTSVAIILFSTGCSQDLSLIVSLPAKNAHHREDLYLNYYIKNNKSIDSILVPKHFVFLVTSDSLSNEAGNIIWELELKNKTNGYRAVRPDEDFNGYPLFFPENDRFIKLGPQKTITKQYPLPVRYTFYQGEYRVRGILIFENAGKNQKLISPWIYFSVDKDYTNAPRSPRMGN